MLDELGFQPNEVMMLGMNYVSFGRRSIFF